MRPTRKFVVSCYFSGLKALHAIYFLQYKLSDEGRREAHSSIEEMLTNDRDKPFSHKLLHQGTDEAWWRRDCRHVCQLIQKKYILASSISTDLLPEILTF